MPWIISKFITTPIGLISQPIDRHYCNHFYRVKTFTSAVADVFNFLFTAVMSHLILDSVAGDIRWLWPFSDEGFQLVTVPTTHTKWYMSFFHHWTFKLEICISILGLLVAGFNDGHKNPKEPS